MSARTEFQHDLEQLHLDMIRMGGLIEEAIDKSIDALEKRDKELAQNIIDNDKEIDDLDRTIEAKCLRLLLKQQPVAGDLRAISTALKMITDMERIGDQAADIADISLRFDDKPFIKTLEHIPLMANIAASMVKDSITAFVKNDIAFANSIMKRDDEVDSLFETVKQDIVAIMLKSTEQVDQAIDFLQIAKYLERIGDHAVNICEWVVFSVTGEHKNKKIL
ncbi:MAG TPA: phosphate signaling complex protein PhoU [Ruminiclostridium sp.]|nr:phosphate signaling complex protein PhoU [Ruminiclostridium sp.]